MELLVTSEDVYNYLNINLATDLGVEGQPNSTTVITEFLKEAQEDVTNYISSHAFGGMTQTKRYFKSGRFDRILKRAILEQVRYVNANPDVRTNAGLMLQNGAIHRLTVDERVEASISPKAVEILSNAGLLYGGRA